LPAASILGGRQGSLGLVTFEWIIGLLLGAVALAALARRIKVPYPTFLAIGGALLAFVPSGPSWTLEPDLALALFVAPVLLDAAFDTSLRDLRNNWLPVAMRKHCGRVRGLSPRMQTPRPSRTTSAPPSPTRGEGKKVATIASYPPSP
jgi:hypothetical protein